MALQLAVTVLPHPPPISVFFLPTQRCLRSVEHEEKEEQSWMVGEQQRQQQRQQQLAISSSPS